MRRSTLSSLSLVLFGFVLFTAFSLWFVHDPTASFPLLVPGMDGEPDSPEIFATKVVIGEFFARGPGLPSEEAALWPQFRGWSSDNIAVGTPPLAGFWGEDSPRTLWSVELGEGHAAPVVAHGSVYLLDYDEELQADTLRRLSLEDGREIWKRYYRVPLKRNHGLSRTSPAVEGDYLVTLGPMCHVMAVHAITGELLWTLDLTERYGTEVPLWYAGQNPLIEKGVLVLAPGGSALLVGIDVATGEVLWETPNPGGWPMAHSSVIPHTTEETQMYLYSSTEGAAGISRHGELLWSYQGWTAPVVVPSPLPLPGGRIFLTAGYGTGSMMLRINKSSGRWEVDELFSFPSGGGLSSEQQTPLFIDGMIIGITPKDAKSLRSRLAASDMEGNILWTAMADERLGLGPYLYADNKLYILKDDGTLFMGTLDRRGFTLLGKKRVLEGTDAWAPMAFAGGKLLLRDTRRLVCLDLR